MDAPIYNLLFPETSVISKESCWDVERTVRSLRDIETVYWIKAWGIVDGDRRSEDDIARLRTNGVFALTHYSVEALYYHPKIIQWVAQRQAKVTGDNAEKLFEKAITRAIDSIRENKNHFVEKSVRRLVREEILASLPNKSEIAANTTVNVSVDISSHREIEKREFEHLMDQDDLEKLMRRYSVRESTALARIADAIGLKKEKYEDAVLKLLQEESEALKFLRSLFEELSEEMCTT